MNKGTPSLLIENHDEALYLWRNAGVRSATLVHVDAHHDMWPPSPDGNITVGNYVWFAMQEGVVDDVYWVVPSQSFSLPSNREAVKEQLLALIRSHRAFSGTILTNGAGMKISVGGKFLNICTIDQLPKVQRPVLLDIDVDYFLLPRVSFSQEAEIPASPPWSWPIDLVRKLQSFPEALMTTIAYSVEGGTTPLEWKFLGDELQIRMSNAADTELSYFELVSNAAMVTGAGLQDQTIESLCWEAISLCPTKPAAYWRLAQHYATTGNPNRARERYRQVVALDPTYGTPFNNKGIVLEAAHRFEDAEAEYELALRMNPHDGNAEIGLARINYHRGDAQGAKKHLVSGLHWNPRSVDGNRLLGDIQAEEDDARGAIGAYERYLEQLRCGEHSFLAPVSTRGIPFDPEEARVRNALAHLYRKVGDREKALACFRSLGNCTTPGRSLTMTHVVIALLLAQSGRSWQSARQLMQAIGAIPVDFVRGFRRFTRLFSSVKKVVL